ncbi:Jacalin-like lectin domain [Phytophthora cactorum]|nr:Jacalin-like lectin domain [Phytophthora cactorum]
MKFIVQVLAAMAFVAGGAAELQDGVQLGETFGGPTATTVRSITIRASDRVDAVSLDVADLKGLTTTLYHGGGGGDPNTLALGENEHIIGIEAHWGKYYRHTRIMYIKFTTDAGNTISGGNPTDQIGKDSAPDGYQLGGFAGFCGDELDSVGAIWTSIKPVESPLK